MVNKVYGYVRVSAKDQNEARQLASMENFGVKKNMIYIDKQSGQNFKRPSYIRMLSKFKENDTLVIASIDRLGRNYDEILEQWRILTKKIKVGIVVLDMPILDTRAERDLTGVLIADIVLQLLSYVAEIEREKIKERQRQGIEAAIVRGVKFGRKEKKLPRNYILMKGLWLSGDISARTAAEKLNVSHATFLRWIKNGR